MESVDVFIFVFCTTGVGKSSLIHRLVGESYDFKSWWNLKYIIIGKNLANYLLIFFLFQVHQHSFL